MPCNLTSSLLRKRMTTFCIFLFRPSIYFNLKGGSFLKSFVYLCNLFFFIKKANHSWNRLVFDLYLFYHLILIFNFFYFFVLVNKGVFLRYDWKFEKTREIAGITITGTTKYFLKIIRHFFILGTYLCEIWLNIVVTWKTIFIWINILCVLIRFLSIKMSKMLHAFWINFVNSGHSVIVT